MLFHHPVLCLVAQSRLTLCDPMNCGRPGASVPGDSPGKNTGVGGHALLQGIFPTQGSNPGLLLRRQVLYWLSHRDAITIPEEHLSKGHITQTSSRLIKHPLSWGENKMCLYWQMWCRWTPAEDSTWQASLRFWISSCNQCRHMTSLKTPF